MTGRNSEAAASAGRSVLTPFLKWAGGKRWLIQHHANIFPKKFIRYIEPFLGSGAVYFFLSPKEAILTDVNAELINAYRVVRNRRRLLEDLLQSHHSKHSTPYYYAVRDLVPSDAVGRAARLIYLNRTCWNGLYRVNQRGQFNVPIGTKNSVLLESDNFLELSKRLRTAQIRVADFEESVDLAQKGDFLFVDPPYTVKHNNNGFLKYNDKIFSWADQIRLAEALGRARRRGAQIVMTNADHLSVRELYGDFSCYSLRRYSVLAGSASNRGPTEELLVANFDLAPVIFTTNASLRGE